MTTARPVIGIVANYLDRTRQSALPHARLNEGYFDAIHRAGGLPLILPPIDDAPLVEQFLDTVDAVLFGGGYDVPPERYGQPSHPRTEPLCQRLVPFLFTVAEAVGRRADLPVLGVCLGAQLLNVVRGGTLHQHLPDLDRAEPIAHSDPERHLVGGRSFHVVELSPTSRLAGAVGAVRVETNSGHHQAIDRLGRGLVATAAAADGVIEAIEDPALPFYLAVQWHPEEMIDRPEHLAIFEAFVAAASGRRG